MIDTVMVMMSVFCTFVVIDDFLVVWPFYMTIYLDARYVCGLCVWLVAPKSLTVVNVLLMKRRRIDLTGSLYAT